jgi:hypothetical protein
MKTKIISKIVLSLGLVFMLGSAIKQVYGGSPESSAYLTSPQDVQLPVITIHSTGDVKRGKSGNIRLEHESSNDTRWRLRKLLCRRHRYPRS